jgi:hypothetical protein
VKVQQLAHGCPENTQVGHGRLQTLQIAKVARTHQVRPYVVRGAPSFEKIAMSNKLHKFSDVLAIGRGDAELREGPSLL